MRKMFHYVVLIPKKQWSEYETAQEIVGVYFSVKELKELLPLGSTIMSEYEFYRYLNMDGINIKANWIIGVYIKQTLTDYYNKMEAR